MDKNVKRIFFVLTLLTLVLAVTTVSATDNDTTDIVTQAPTVVQDVSNDVIQSEIIQSSDDNPVNAKDVIVKKENKNVKKDPVTIDGVEYDHVYANQTITRLRITNNENEKTYIKNCNFTENDDEDDFRVNNYGTIYIDNIKGVYEKVRLNNLNEGSIMIINNTNLVFNKIIISNYGTLYIYNSTLNSSIYNSNKIIIDDLSQKGSKLSFDGDGEIITNNTAFGIYSGDNTITDQIIDTDITNNGNLNISNCTVNNKITNKGNISVTNSTLNSKIINDGVLTIDDSTIFGENFNIEGNGEIIINDINKILPYLRSINGNYTINNIIFDKGFTFNGNITLINCDITEDGYIRSYSNYGILNLKNCTVNISNRSNIQNYNIIIIDEDTQIISGNIQGNGTIFYGEIPEGYFDQPTEYNGENTQENMNLVRRFTNNGNLTLLNCTISTKITNQGNITLRNSHISELITNNGNITFINCSFSNNNMTVGNLNTFYYSFLLDNRGTARLENCIIENNAFNTTTTRNYVYLNGAILNNGTMTVVDTVACNNSLGYTYLDPDSQIFDGRSVGRGTVLSNFGNLTVENSNFTDNYAGECGAAIFDAGNLTVNNSVFENNLADVCGGAIAVTPTSYDDSNIRNVLITDSIFKENKVFLHIRNNQASLGGGAIHAGNINGTILNCTFDNNLAETNVVGIYGISTNGGSILYDSYSRIGSTGIGFNLNVIDSTFTNHEGNIITDGNSYTPGCNGSIDNCIFENNKGGIIDNGNLNITNNIFKNTTETEAIIQNVASTRGQIKTISNNQFINNNVTRDTIYNYNSSNYYGQKPINITVENNTYKNTTINDTIDLNIPSKIYTGEPITITGTYNINNPENYDQDITDKTKFNVYINGNLNQTVDTLEFTITPTAGSMIVTVQPTISQTRKSTSIRATTLTNITITPENYNEYIYEGTLIGVGKDTKITFNGQFTDKGEIYIDTSDIIMDGSNATFTNTKFTLDAENIVIQNMNINNTNTNYPISNYKDNNIIANNTITLNNPNSNATAIYNGASNTLIANNTLTVTALAGSIDFSVWGVADTQAILLLGGDKNTVQNNNINIKSTQATGYNTLEAITNSNGATNTLIKQNTITISDANFNYAIDCLSNVENITITENTLLVTGERYCDGIQVGNGANNIVIDNNNITCTCINTTVLDSEGAITYGVIATSMGSAESNNITITNNNIDITGTVNYAIELYKVNNTEIHNNNITVTGPYSLGIGYSYTPNGNATRNTITITGDSTTPINAITEEIKPENTGIRIQNGTQNVYLEDNTITTSDIGAKDTTINTDEATVTIKNNKLTSSTGYGDETVKTFKPGVTFENNVIETTITTEDITTLTNTPTTLTATITTETGANVNGGTVTFTDTNGNTIAETAVTDGTATATATFTQADESTITATYTPTSTGLTSSTTTATLTVKDKFQTSITIDEITATAGETITLTANVTDENGEAVTGGKVTFKINGKTIKDASGKVVYAKVVDGIATAEYTVPENLGGQDINITAVYSGTSKYNKETTTITTTVTAPEAKLTITPITSDVQTGSTVTLKAKVATGDKAITTGKIVFKINGKTVKDANGKVIYAKVDTNGEVSVDYTLPESFKAGTYNIEAVFTAPGYDKLTSNTTMTVVKS